MPEEFIRPTYNAVSFSGGKDSTAMLLMLLERGVKIDLVVNITSTWEFPQIVEHVKRIKKDTEGQVGKFVILNAPLDYYLIHHKTKPSLHYPNGRVGYGWACIKCRWCTSAKIDMIDRAVNLEVLQLAAVSAVNLTQYVGISLDESKRVKEKPFLKYPLFEWGITGKDALQYCYDRGYDFGGVYNYFDRVSCFCCPFMGVKDLYTLHKFFPDLWAKLMEKDRQQAHTAKFNRSDRFSKLIDKIDKYGETVE